MSDLRSQLRAYYESVIWLRDPGEVIAGRTGGVTVTQEPETFRTRRWWSQPAVVVAAVALLALVMFGGGVLLGLRLGGGDDVTDQTTTTTTSTATTTTTTPPRVVEVFPVSVDAPILGSRDLVAVSAREVWDITTGLIGRLEDGDWTLWRLVPSRRISGLAVAPDGTVWVAADSGVFSFDGAAWTRNFDDPAETVGVSEDGTVWIGGTAGAEHGLLWLARWDGESWVRFDETGPATSGSSAAPPVGMTVLPDGEVWIVAPMFGWGGDLLVRHDGTTMGRVDIWDYVNPGPAMFVETAAAPNGDLVVGGFTDNIDRQYRVARFDGEQWTTWPADDWPSAETTGASDVAMAPDGVLWLVFESGLASVDGAEWTTRIEGPGVSAVDVAPDGTIWYADDQGVHIFSTP